VFFVSATARLSTVDMWRSATSITIWAPACVSLRGFTRYPLRAA
jgi:hypothetical protein